MSTINTDLIAHIYAASESPLTNDELYREVQRKTGMSDAELHELKEFGSDKTRTSGVKHKGSLVSADSPSGRGHRTRSRKTGRLEIRL